MADVRRSPWLLVVVAYFGLNALLAFGVWVLDVPVASNDFAAALVAVFGTVTYGLWNVRPWARRGAIVVVSLGLVVSLLALLAGDATVAYSGPVQGLVLGYLWKHKHTFEAVHRDGSSDRLPPALAPDAGREGDE